MFMRYFVEVAVPVAQVESVLLGSPAAWLPGLAEDARLHGQGLLAEAGFATPVGVVAREVEVSVGRAVRFPSKLAVPMTGEPAAGEALLPGLEADLEVGPLGPRRTQLGINATYTPPLGVIGRTADRLLLHRVAEATLKRFLDQVAERIAGQAQDQAGDAALSRRNGAAAI
jgi:hypothetical protein